MRPLADRSRPRLALPFVMTAILLAAPAAGSASLGKWTPKVNWDPTGNRIAIHMLLLRGDGAPYHSRVLWFGSEDHGVFKGGLWGWKTGNDGCTSYPVASFDTIAAPNVGYNVFCSGHSGLADGRVFVAGGNSTWIDTYGVDSAAFHMTGTGTDPGSWTIPAPMGARRWYPTNTTLRDGRVLVTAGYQHRQHWMFGGVSAGSAPVSPDTVRRWAPVKGGAWDPPVEPEQDPDQSSNPRRPHPVEGHTGTSLDGVSGFDGQAVFFGGKRGNGVPVTDLWALRREDNPTGADYRYVWDKKTPSGGPSARSEHSAVLSGRSVLIFGGREEDGTPRNDVFRYTPGTGTEGTWTEIEIESGTISPRMGHVAIYNEMEILGPGVKEKVKRMIVFGGVGADGVPQTDTSVYELRFNPTDTTKASWLKMPTDTSFFYHGFNKRPAPRYWHRGVATLKNQTLAGGSPKADLAYIFGGALGGGAYSDTLWMMCIFETNMVGWVYRQVDEGAKPSARARFSMAFDPQQGHNSGPRLYVHGGEGVSGLADPGLYVIDHSIYKATNNWEQWGAADVSATGHVSVREEGERHSRRGEIFDPATGTWTTLSSASLLERSYPLTFAVSGGSSAGGRIVTASSWDNKTRYIDLPGSGSSSGAWQEAYDPVGFAAEGGVLYRPNKLLVAGGGVPAVGTSKTLDASNTSNTWATTASMLPRRFHNLVLLPNGKTLVTGGVNTAPVQQPQIWDPDGNNGTGTWTVSGSLGLASSTAVRDYHSTSILLPDGRVLCAGGFGYDDRFQADIYCPPYLFKPDTEDPAVRPVVTSAPNRMTWGDPGSYTLCVSDASNVTRASLIRSGMTTHGFDQNQRYVPLTPTLASSPSRILIPPPATSSDAPPGDYLLFVTGSADGADVPSVARWISVGASVASDSCDVTAPAAVSNLSRTPCHEGVDNQYLITWTAPADDGSFAPSRRATLYEIRQYGAPITDANWHLAEPIGGPVPADPGATESMVVTVSDLTYIRMKAKDNRDGAGNWSGLSNQVSLNPVVCGEGMWAGGGGGGGGSSLRQAAGTASASRGSLDSYMAMENSLLNGVSAGTRGRDHLALGPLALEADGTCMLRVRDTENHAAVLDAVNLLTVDHSGDVTPYVLDGSVVLGTRQNADGITTRDGTDITGTLGGGNSYELGANDTLNVALGPGGGASPLILAAHGRGALEALTSDGQGGWRVARVFPRAAPDELVLAAPGVDQVRLVSRGSLSIGFVGRLVLSPESPTIRTAALVSGSQVGVGDVALDIAAADSAATTLVGPDTLVLRFRPEPPLEGTVRHYFLVVDATPLNPAAAVPLGRQDQRAPLPARFALRDVTPNPFAKATSVRFELPVGAVVRLEVFDAQGRRITTLANRFYAAGFHAIPWAPSMIGVGPGVYFCRMEAGAYRARTRMVLLP